MFLSYYGFGEQPFGVTPDARYLYMSASHREALASLLYGIQTGRGFLALIAPPGMGKTTVLFQLMEQLQKSSRTVFLFQTQGNSAEFLASLIADLGLTPAHGNLGQLQGQLNEVLVREAQMGRQFVLIIDEAQNLQDDVLESVRMLSNFETPNKKLMQIILAGQPQLADKLASAKLTQLRQRVSVISHIEPLSPDDGLRYIENRLRVAGYRGRGPLFTPDALKMLLDRSEGIPRNINNICFHALSLGYAKGQKTIDESTVAEVLVDLEIELLGTGAGDARARSWVPEDAPQQGPPGPDNPEPVSAYQYSNPWYRASAPGSPINHPFNRKRAHWIVRACVLLALAAGGGLIWAGALGHSGRFSVALSRLRYDLLSAHNGQVSSAVSGEQRQGPSDGDDIASTPKKGLSQPARPLTATKTTPALAASAPAQTGNLARPAEHEALPSHITDGAIPADGPDKAMRTSLPEADSQTPTVPISSRQEPPQGSDFASARDSSASVNHRTGELVIEANVGDARVFINGRSEPGWVTPHTFVLPPGTYWIQVTKYGHTSWYGSIHISRGGTRWAVANLGRANGAILIETDPSRMPVFIDGEAYGPSPIESTLSIGRHTYKVIPQDGSEPYTGSFVLKPADILRIRVKWPVSGRHPTEGASGQSEVQGTGLPSEGGSLEQKF